MFAVAMPELTPPAVSATDGAPPAVDPATLWEQFGPPLRGFLARRVPPGVDADDLVQEVFLRVIRGLATLRGTDRPEAWLFQIARNALRDSLRTRLRRDGRTDPLDGDLPADVDPAADRVAEAELAPCLTAMIDRLAEPYRTAITLTSLQGVSQADAARRLGVSASGMKSRVRRGRVQLRQMLVSCCSIALDVRGGVSDFHKRAPRACGAPEKATVDGCGAAPCGTDAERVASMDTGRRLQERGREWTRSAAGEIAMSRLESSPTPPVDTHTDTVSPAGDCCGAPAPAATEACCVRDAELKAAGEAGCGCGAPASAAATQAPTRPRCC